jgi:hypothetical protein
MANTFKSYKQRNIGTSAANVITANAATQTIVIGLSLSNITTNSITADAYVTSGGNNYYLVKNAPVPVGSSLIVVGGDQKIALSAGENVSVVSSSTTSIDAFLSVLEIT